MRTFPNPEARWDRRRIRRRIARADIIRRIGATGEPFRVLSGGRANLNVRVGSDRVVRIHQRDPETRAKEETLLQRGWIAFRVPAVLASGDDFLVLEYVPHRTLGVTADHGAAIGRALAEIHRTRFASAGFLDASLTLRERFDAIIEALIAHARSEFDAARSPLHPRLRELIETTWSAQREALEAAAQAAVLLHGDFKPSNLHWTHDGRLLVLDWEFAYAGPALMDIGQVLRWAPPHPFTAAFADAYQRNGGELPRDWVRLSSLFDLFNLASLRRTAAPRSRRALDVDARIGVTTTLFA